LGGEKGASRRNRLHLERRIKTSAHGTGETELHVIIASLSRRISKCNVHKVTSVFVISKYWMRRKMAAFGDCKNKWQDTVNAFGAMSTSVALIRCSSKKSDILLYQHIIDTNV